MQRIIDANFNRSSEGARVLEEISRFILEDESLSESFKNIRHSINKISDNYYSDNLSSRDSEHDIGINICNPDTRAGVDTIFKANIKRLEEALRVLFEYTGMGEFEKMRYKVYTLEKMMYSKLLEKFSKLRLKDTKLYLVTNSDKFKTEDEFLNAVASALQGGVDIVQLREKTRDAASTLELAKKIRQLCDEFNSIFIVNDRVDIAYLSGADGVHLGQDDISPQEARKILGDNTIIGVSTHAPEQARRAVADGADYIGAGPVYITPTKPGRASVGLEYIEWVSKNINIPAFAIGGIDLENADTVLNTGIGRIAVVRAIINSDNPKDAAEKLKSKI